MTILLVEDEKQVGPALQQLLLRHGYHVQHVGTGAAAREAAASGQADLIIMDLNLPDVDGLILCSDLKQIAEIPIIICSSRSAHVDRVLGLRLGADDFITRPFDSEDVIARVESVLRRRGAHAQLTSGVSLGQEIRIGNLVIQSEPDRVLANGQRVHLIPTEHRLLMLLASYSGQALTRQDIAGTLWPDRAASTGSINFHICRVRAKLARAGLAEPAIVAVRQRFAFTESPLRGGVPRTRERV